MTIDIGKLHAGDSVKLSNGNTLKVTSIMIDASPVIVTLRFSSIATSPVLREPKWTVSFEGGLQLSNLNTDGTSQNEDGISIVEVYTDVDLSTVKIGDTLITRDGGEIPWNHISKVDVDSSLYFVILDGVKRSVTKNGRWGSPDVDSGFDVVSIRRSSLTDRQSIAVIWKLG